MILHRENDSEENIRLHLSEGRWNGLKSGLITLEGSWGPCICLKVITYGILTAATYIKRHGWKTLANQDPSPLSHLTLLSLPV